VHNRKTPDLTATAPRADDANSGGRLGQFDGLLLDSRIRKPERLDETMTRSDIIDKRLRFDVDDQCAIWLDRSVRDFLVTALTNAHRK